MNLNRSLQRYETYDWGLPRDPMMVTQTMLKYQKKKKFSPLTENFRPILIMSRILGCYPHTIFTKKKVQTSLLLKAYSIICCLSPIFPIFLEINELFVCRRSTDRKVRDCTIQIADKIGILFHYFICASFSVLRASRFENGIAKIQEFDAVTNTGKKINLLENFIAAIVVLAVWPPVIWIFTDFSMPTEIWQMYYLIATSLMSLEAYKFCFVFMALTRRFVRLRKIFLSRKIFINSSDGLYYQPLTAHDILIIHRGLVNAVKNFNKYFDVQIAYLCSYSVVSLLLRGIMACDNYTRLPLTPRQVALFIFTIYNPALICAFAHSTSKMANALGGLLFEHEMTASSHGNLELALYFHRQPFNIMACGLFYVELPFLMTVMQAFVSYTTFMLQAMVDEHKLLALRANFRPGMGK